MADFGSLDERLNNLEKRIGAARERLSLHDRLHQDHSATLDELTEHYRHRQAQLRSETANLEEQGVHVESFEKTVLAWIDGLTLNS